MRVAFVVKLIKFYNLKIKITKKLETLKDQTSATDVEEFWIGMLLSLSETQDRRYKASKSMRAEGVTQGIALQAKGFVT